MSLTESAAFDAAHSASLASRRLATLNNDERNKALTLLHDALETNREDILKANARDVELATIAAESGNLSQSVLKRLDLSRPGKYQDMLDGILSVRDLDDPSECSFQYLSLMRRDLTQS
jgi:glutamate-5-semialdehyde dehydrogenase